MRRNILFVSMCLPFDKVGHAGGKTFNYYINRFSEDCNNDIRLIAKILPEEEKYVDTINSKIYLYSVSTPKNFIKRSIAYVNSLNSKINPFYKYGNTLTWEIYKQIYSRLLELKIENYVPDIIVLEWTSMLLFVEKVKEVFPNAVYVASEHDVTFLGCERKMLYSKNYFDKIIKTISYHTMLKNELKAIRICDLVVTHNYKDMKLLVENGIEETKLNAITPFFDMFSVLNRKSNNKDIIYYGAMNRLENHISAMWFIENVMPLLKDYDIKFTVIGNKPRKELLNMQSDKIVVTGFVDDPSVYFENAMCMAAPLILGAGVKVKIIEALSSGILVLTNDIGIEGINASDGKEYIHCTTAQDYADTIINLINNGIDREKIGDSAIAFIKENYNLEKSFDRYSKKVYSLLRNSTIKNV